MSERIEAFKRELEDMGFTYLWTDTQIVDARSGEVVARAKTAIAGEDMDRVLWLVLEDDNSTWHILDNVIFKVRGLGDA